MRRTTRPRTGTRLTGFASAILVAVAPSTSAQAQSREYRYCLPTETVNRDDQTSGVLRVLPETGGPLALFAGVALIIAGTSTALVRRHAGRG